MFYFNKKAGNTTSKDYDEQLEQDIWQCPFKGDKQYNWLAISIKGYAPLLTRKTPVCYKCLMRETRFLFSGIRMGRVALI